MFLHKYLQTVIF